MIGPRSLAKLLIGAVTLTLLALIPGRAAAARRANPGHHRARTAARRVTTRTRVHRTRPLATRARRANRRLESVAVPLTNPELASPPIHPELISPPIHPELISSPIRPELISSPIRPELVSPSTNRELPARQPTIPLLWGLSLPSVEAPVLTEPPSTNWPLAPLDFIGVVEAPSRALRLAVFNVNGRVVYGRVGEVVADHYRVRSFSDQLAEVFDTASETVLRAVPPSPLSTAPMSAPETARPPQPASAQTGMLRLVAQPGQALTFPIFIDGVYAGTIADLGEAPGGLPLEAGVHRLELGAPESQPVAIEIRIDPNRTTTYNVGPPRREP